MNATDPVYTLHLKWGERSPLLLHPFGKAATLVGNERPVAGLYGADPQLEVVNQFRDLLYRQIDQDIRAWLSEQRFIPRILVASLVFLVLYFVLSFAIRDPIPMVVQITGASVAAVAVFIWMGRRDELSSIAVEKRARSRAVVDTINFSYSPLLEALEDLIQSYLEQPQQALDGLWTEIRRTAANDTDHLAEHIIQAIKLRYSETTLLKLQRRFVSDSGDLASEVPFEALMQWSRSYRVDSGLMALYLSLASDTVS